MQHRMEQLLSKISLVGLIVAVITMFTGCQAIADIFKAGVWVGVIIVVVVIGIIAFIASMFKK